MKSSLQRWAIVCLWFAYNIVFINCANTVHGGEISHSNSWKYSNNITRYYYYNASKNDPNLQNPLVYINLLATEPLNLENSSPIPERQTSTTEIPEVEESTTTTHNEASTEEVLKYRLNNSAEVQNEARNGKHDSKSIHVSRDEVISYQGSPERVKEKPNHDAVIQLPYSNDIGKPDIVEGLVNITRVYPNSSTANRNHILKNIHDKGVALGIVLKQNQTNKITNIDSTLHQRAVSEVASTNQDSLPGNISDAHWLDNEQMSVDHWLSPLTFSTNQRRLYSSKFSVEELLGKHFEKRISNDIFMDPCKAGEQLFLLE